MATTQKERDFWIEELSNDIQVATDEMKRDNPDFFRQVENETHRNALASLGIADMDAALEDTKESIRTLERNVEELNKSKLAKIFGCDVADLDEHRRRSNRHSHYYNNGIESEISENVQLREKTEKRQILEASELGRRVLELELAKKRMRRTVGLATSSQQIKDIVTVTGEFLDRSMSTLEEAATASPAEVPCGHHATAVATTATTEEDDE